MASPWKDARGIIVSTTPTLEGRPIQEYCGIVTGEVIGPSGSMLMVSASGTAVRV